LSTMGKLALITIIVGVGILLVIAAAIVLM
jgi:hypothetical protein